MIEREGEREARERERDRQIERQRERQRWGSVKKKEESVVDKKRRTLGKGNDGEQNKRYEILEKRSRGK